MTRRSRYSPEVKERAVRMVFDQQAQHESQWSAISSIASKIDGCVPRSVEKERHPPLRHQSIRSGGNLRVFENLAQTLVAVDAS